MKCNICGKEFGKGTNCQSCGIDRVQGLASYSGFSPSPSRSSDTRQRNDNGRYVSLNNMQSGNTLAACFACGEIIPNDSEFCPKCGKKLIEKCPNCGSICSTQYEYCNKCGTNRAEYIRAQKKKEQEEKQRKAQEEQRKREEAKRREIEQLRQKQLQEEESRKKAEAFNLKVEIENQGETLYHIGLAVIIIIFLFICIIFGIKNIALGIFVFWPISFIVLLEIHEVFREKREKNRLEKYKRTHPDDWRIKYW